MGEKGDACNADYHGDGNLTWVLEDFMIKSMTGFGRCEVTEDQWKMTVEIKAVNHRYLDVSVKMPKKLSIFESSIRTVLKEYMERGKVDVFVS